VTKPARSRLPPPPPGFWNRLRSRIARRLLGRVTTLAEDSGPGRSPWASSCLVRQERWWRVRPRSIQSVGGTTSGHYSVSIEMC